jgi:hypothetical protein
MPSQVAHPSHILKAFNSTQKVHNHGAIVAISIATHDMLCQLQS